MSRSWPPHPLPELRRSLDDLAISVADGQRKRTDDEQIWLARFLVVRTCGYLEQVVHETIRGYIHAKSGGLVRSFAYSWMSRSRTPSPENMLDLTNRLDLKLANNLRDLLDADDQRLYREISLLVDRRHKIAHGLNEGIGPTKAVALRVETLRVAEWFIRQLDPYNNR